MGSSPKSRPRRVGRALLALAVLVAALLVLGKVWLGPYLVRRALRRQFAEFWDGPIRIGRIELNASAPMRLADFALLDRAGRTWLAAEGLSLALRDWPGFSPGARTLHVRRATFCAFVRDGRIRPPIKSYEKLRRFLEEFVEIDSAELDDVSFDVLTDGGARSRIAGAGISYRRQGRRSQLWLTRPPRGRIALGARHGWMSLAPSPENDAFKLACTFDSKTWGARIELAMAQRLAERDGAALLSLLDLPADFRAAGTARADLTLTGRLDRPASLTPAGTVRLADWTLRCDDGAIGRDGRLVVRLDGARGRFTRGAIVTDLGTVRLADSPYRFDPAARRLHADLTLEVTIDHDRRRGGFLSSRLWLHNAVGCAALGGPATFQPGGGMPFACDLRGWLELKTLTLPRPGPLTATDLRCGRVRLTERAAAIDDLSGKAYGGRLRARLRADWGEGGGVRVSGQVEARDVSMAQITRALSPGRPMEEGKGALSLRFRCRAGAVATLRAEGRLLVRRGDLWNTPVLAAAYKKVRLARSLADAEAVFTLTANVATFRAASLAGALSAVIVEPGGTADLQTHHVDLYLVIAPLKSLRGLLRRVPLVGMLVSAQEDLTRLHVRGGWEEDAEVQVEAMSLKTLGRETLGLFQRIKDGKLGEGLLAPLKDALKGAKGNGHR